MVSPSDPRGSAVFEWEGEDGGSSVWSELAMVRCGVLASVRARGRGYACWRSARFGVVEVLSVRSIGGGWSRVRAQGTQSAVLVITYTAEDAFMAPAIYWAYNL